MRLAVPWCPSDNNYYTVARGRKILSAKGRAYQTLALLKIRQQVHGVMFRRKVLVDVTAHPPDLRRRDLANLCKALGDVLSGSVIVDDSQIVVWKLAWGPLVKGGELDVWVSQIEP